MMWLRECAIALVVVLRQAKQLDAVDRMEQIITRLTGRDGGVITPTQLNAFLPTIDIKALGLLRNPSVPTLELRGILTKILSRYDEMNSVSQSLSFGLCRNPFSFNELVLSNVVDKLNHRVPTASLDVGFAFMGNDVALGPIVSRMTSDHTALGDTERFRDGFPYTEKLLALRRTIDRVCQPEAMGSIVDHWIHVLRQLSKIPQADAPTFHTEAWGLRMLNTQAASLTQLHWNAVSYTDPRVPLWLMGATYPAAYVEPYPEFWRAFRNMTTEFHCMLDTLELPNKALESFDSVLGTLHEISIVQAKKKLLNKEQTDFLQGIMGGSDASLYPGWYSSLFYPHREDAGARDVLVADVHTDQSCSDRHDPGHIVHLGVGHVLMGYFIVDSVMYAGPVFSSYEFTTSLRRGIRSE